MSLTPLVSFILLASDISLACIGQVLELLGIYTKGGRGKKKVPTGSSDTDPDPLGAASPSPSVSTATATVTATSAAASRVSDKMRTAAVGFLRIHEEKLPSLQEQLQVTPTTHATSRSRYELTLLFDVGIIVCN